MLDQWETPVIFLIMTQVELAESVFAKLAESMDVVPESGETMEFGK